MIFYFFITLFIAYELQSLLQGKIFKMFDIYTRYKKQFKNRWKNYFEVSSGKIKSKLMSALLRNSFFQLFYMTFVVIGMFSSFNYLFFIGVFILSLLQELWRKLFKKSYLMRKVCYNLDSILTIVFLGLAVYNFMFYKMDSLALVRMLIDKIHF